MALSYSKKRRLKKRYSQLVCAFILFAITSAIVSVGSYILQFTPYFGITAEDFSKNATALPDMTVGRVLFGTWCLFGLLALWWPKVWSIFTNLGALVEDATISVLGASFGLFLVAVPTIGIAPPLAIAFISSCFLIISAVGRIWIADDVRSFLFARILLSAFAVFGLWLGLADPRYWPWPLG